ncbi:MAG: DNA polymerase/3'-5' exonuclease PolX [Candidatus Lokiarchaeota archaeon]|nr:DNA polymerase/3'-5' exonuclease PolX [Candidatus Lokiarchaeota archaeon]MBD3201005.1 DNA polymerase/3'-5' exonuclease PolX [Candidatus Lokiarchaeota archaeon]
MSHVSNKKIANLLFEIADLLELKGVQFKPRAYRRAAQNISTLSKDIKRFYEEKKLQDIEGVGESIAEKLEEIIETGDLEYLNDLRKDFPEGLQEMMNIQGLGPKSLMKFYEELGLDSVDHLEEAAKNGEIRKLEGFGKTSEKNILENLERYRKYKKRFILGEILPIAKNLEKQLSNHEDVKRVNLAGSIRRRKETIGDVDILAVSSNPKKIMDYFTNLPEIERVVSKGITKSTVIAQENLHIDLRVIEEESFGSALQYFTGSKEHNIELRTLASDKEWKLSEYGLIDMKTTKTIAGKEEKEIYNSLGLDYIVPELRENRGEIQAAKSGDLPDLIKKGDIVGDLHVHTNWSDGSQSIDEIVQTAQNMGYKYLAICDHAKSLQIADGLNDSEIKKQMSEISKLDKIYKSITVFSGIEANIDKKGKLDVRKNILKDLDIVIGSIHSGFKLSEKEMTNRIVNAMHNDYITLLGHPTGRLLNQRESYNLDLNKIFEIAEKLELVLELNAYPQRLDLNDINCFNSRDYNFLISINTDAHTKDGLKNMDLGVSTARRGWLDKGKVLNTKSLEDLKKHLNL